MNSFEQFLRRISRLLAQAVPAARLDELGKLNPERIYLENVRSALGTSAWTARVLCEFSVKRGIFSKRVQVLCPDGAVAASAAQERELPKRVRCWVEQDGNLEAVEYETEHLQKIEFYAFNGLGAHR